MCDRRTAIQYVITNQYGSKAELKEKIREHYEVFLITGFIYEPAKIPESIVPRSCCKQVREWIATSEAYDRARILLIKPDKRLKLKSTPDFRLKRRNRFLERLFAKILH